MRGVSFRAADVKKLSRFRRRFRPEKALLLSTLMTPFAEPAAWAQMQLPEIVIEAGRLPSREGG